MTYAITNDFNAVAAQIRSTLIARLEDDFLPAFRTATSLALPMPTDAMIYACDRLTVRSDGTKTQFVISNEGETYTPRTGVDMYDVASTIAVTVLVASESQQVTDSDGMYKAANAYCTAIAFCVDAWLANDGSALGVKNATITEVFGTPSISIDESETWNYYAASCTLDITREVARPTMVNP